MESHVYNDLNIQEFMISRFKSFLYIALLIIYLKIEMSNVGDEGLFPLFKF